MRRSARSGGAVYQVPRAGRGGRGAEFPAPPGAAGQAGPRHRLLVAARAGKPAARPGRRP